VNAPPLAPAAERRVVECARALGALETFDAIVDVRSPGEYAEDHVPGAINAPVLDDTERAQIGTLHKHGGTFAAKRRGAALVARNIAAHLERDFADKPRTWRPLVYCWRGGQRSAAMTHVLNRVGWPAVQLEGGYRAYRRLVVAELSELPSRFRWRVIAGTTGSGKSRLLQQLSEVGAQVLDLEALACHRGSVLGGLPQAPQPSQKMFESRLWSSLRSLHPAQPVFVESESRKVGAVHLPDALLAAIRAADGLRLELPLEARIALLREDYAHFEQAPDALIEQLQCLTPLHGRARIAEWIALARAADWEGLVRRLLVEHYDPAYRASIGRNFGRVAAGEVVSADEGSAAALRRIAEKLVAA
jgi:tRNA 2-selenouridine synthase